MGRRRKSEENSLELLLDTMCNTFGGIVFITMLVALISNDTQSKVISETEPAKLKQIKVKQLANDLAEKKRQLAEIAIVNKFKEQELENLKNDSKMKLIPQLIRTKEQNHQKEKKLQELKEKHALQQELKFEMANVDENIENLEKELLKLKLDLAKVSTKQERIFKLPQLKETNKLPIWATLKNGKLYIFSKIRNRQTVGLDNDYCTYEERHLKTMIWVMTDYSNGIRIQDGLKTVQKKVNTRLSGMQRQYFIAVFVYEDSFADFINLKQVLVKMGFAYDWQPIRAGNNVILYNTSEPIKYNTQ